MKRLKEEARITGAPVRFFSVHELDAHMADAAVHIHVGTTNLAEFDRIYFYAVGSHKEEIKEIAHYLGSKGTVILDPAIQEGCFPLDKLFLSQQHYIPFPKSTFYFSLKEKDIAKLTYPVIIKSIEGSKGRTVTLAKNQQDIERHIAKHSAKCIIQEYIPIESDMRVLVINGEIQGVLERFKQGDNFLTTKPRGIRKSTTIPKSLEKKIKQLVRAKGLFFAGVDIAFHNDTYYCFEVNSSPQVRVFERETKINIAQNFLKHITTKKVV